VVADAARARPAPAVVARAVYQLPGDAVRRTIQRPQRAISPDGRYIASLRGAEATTGAAVLRRIDQLDWTAPDSQWLGFWNSRQIKRVSVRAVRRRTVHALATAQLNGAQAVSWADTGVIYVVDGLRIVGPPAGGGTATTILEGLHEGRRIFGVEELQALPGGRGLLYARITTASATARMSCTASARARMWISSRVARRGICRLLICCSRVSRRPLPRCHRWLAVRCTYIPGTVSSEPISTLYRVSREGVPIETAAPPRESSDPRVSPDGRRVAPHASDQQNDVWGLQAAPRRVAVTPKS
jgi:hypothetical protein